MNPDWVSLGRIPIEGTQVLNDLGADEWLGIDVWLSQEFKLPSDARVGAALELPPAGPRRAARTWAGEVQDLPHRSASPLV